MKDRLIQLFARYIAAGMLAVAGYITGGTPTEDTVGSANSIATAIAVGVVAALFLLWDLVSHKLQNGWWFKNEDQADTPRPKASGGGVTRYALLIGMLGLFVLAGCGGTTASQRWGGLTLGYTGALQTAVDLRRQGHIDDEQYRDIEQVRAPLGSALDIAKDRILMGDDDGAMGDLDRAADFLDTLARLLSQAQNGEPPDAPD